MLKLFPLCFEPQPLLQIGNQSFAFASMQKPEAHFSCDTEIRFFERPLLGEFWPFCPEGPQTPSLPDFTPEVACAT